MSTIKPREAEHVIYQGDDLAHLAELRQAAESARRRAASDNLSPLRVGDEAASSAAEEAAYDEAVAEAAERALIVRVRAIGRRRFRDLMAEHPPREVEVTKTTDDTERTVTETHPDDAPYEVNTSTFPDALLMFADDDTATIAEPEFPTKARKAFLEDDISDGDFDSLWLTAYYLNRSPSADPKASRYSTGSPRLNET